MERYDLTLSCYIYCSYFFLPSVDWFKFNEQRFELQWSYGITSRINRLTATSKIVVSIYMFAFYFIYTRKPLLIISFFNILSTNLACILFIYRYFGCNKRMSEGGPANLNSSLINTEYDTLFETKQQKL